MYKSLVQRGPLVVQKVSEQLRSLAAGTRLHIREKHSPAGTNTDKEQRELGAEGGRGGGQ